MKVGGEVNYNVYKIGLKNNWQKVIDFYNRCKSRRFKYKIYKRIESLKKKTKSN